MLWSLGKNTSIRNLKRSRTHEYRKGKLSAAGMFLGFRRFVAEGVY